MSNQCQQLQIDEVYINGVLEAFEEKSASIENPTGWDNEGVPAATGDHGTRRKRTVPMLKYKLMTGASFDVNKYGNLDLVEITVRDAVTQRRGRIARASYATMNDLGGGENPEVKWILNSPIQWL